MKLKGKIKKRYFLFAIILIVAVIALWRTLNAPLPQYQTLIVRHGDLQQSVLATGKLDALRKVDVGAQVSGQLKTLSVAIGDKVKRISCSALSILNRRKTKSKRLKQR